MQNFFDFTGKVVLVTGGSSGIGRATAEFFGRCGASVAVSYLKNRSGADAAVAAISTTGAVSSNGAAVGVATEHAIAIQADVINTNEIENLVRDVEDRLGPIDILVNNAGSLVERLKTLELTEERWDEVMELNAKSAFFCAQ